MDVKKLQRAVIKLTGVFPEEMDLLKEWFAELHKDAEQGAKFHKEPTVIFRFIGRYSVIDDILEYLNNPEGKKK